MTFLKECLAAILVAFASGLPAAVLLVPEDYETPGEAMEAAVNGDEIIVSPGVYCSSIAFRGKTVILRSEDPDDPDVVASTVLDCDGTAILFDGDEGSGAVLAGFTISGNRYSRSGGGGISGNGTLATIRKNVIQDSSAFFGGAIWDCDGVIEDNIIRNNKADTRGGGLADCDGLIRRNEITGNIASGGSFDGESYPPEGGGLSDCDGMITENYIAHNRAGVGTGLEYVGVFSLGFGGGIRGPGEIYYNVFFRNVATLGGGIDGSSGPIVGNMFVENVAASWLPSDQYGTLTLEGGGGATRGCFANHSNNLFYGNVAGGTAGGAHVHVGYMNNLSHANKAPRGPNFWESSRPSEVRGNIIEGWDGDPAMASDLDPRFVDVENGDFRLRPDSPAIDAGVSITGIDMDIVGNPRPVKSIGFEFRGDGSGFDVGPYEYQGTIEPEDTTLSTLLGILPSYDEQDINQDLRVDIADIVSRRALRARP